MQVVRLTAKTFQYQLTVPLSSTLNLQVTGALQKNSHSLWTVDELKTFIHNKPATWLQAAFSVSQRHSFKVKVKVKIEVRFQVAQGTNHRTLMRLQQETTTRVT